MTDYLIDANVLIQAKNLHYGFDFLPCLLGLARGAESHRKGREHPEGRR